MLSLSRPDPARSKRFEPIRPIIICDIYEFRENWRAFFRKCSGLYQFPIRKSVEPVPIVSICFSAGFCTNLLRFCHQLSGFLKFIINTSSECVLIVYLLFFRSLYNMLTSLFDKPSNSFGKICENFVLFTVLSQ